MRPDEREKLLAFARGEATWAEVEGITAAEAARSPGAWSSPPGRLRQEARAGLRGDGGNESTRRRAHAALGTVYQKLERAEDAVTAYGAALALDPVHPVALGNRGELLLRMGRREGFGDVAAAVQADPEGRTAAGRRAARLARAITADALARLGVQ
jgi:tetratricopeptide (TPR) repeat protein